MRYVAGALLAVVFLSACSSDEDLEHQAAETLRTCMQLGGIRAQNVTFEIERRRLVDWNVIYPGQGQPESDNVHNACIRRLVEDLALEAQLP